VPQEISKPFCSFIVLEVLSSGSATTNGEKDGLAQTLAVGDILPDLVAATEQVGTVEEGSITLVGKVATGPIVHGSREFINEPEVDDIV
jgi:hypothetical protein